MTGELEPGLREQLVTEELHERLAALDPHLHADEEELHNAEAADRLSRHLAALVARMIDARPETERRAWGTQLTRALVERLGELAGRRGAPTLAELPVQEGQILTGVFRRLPTGEPARPERPLTPLLDTTLLTNSPGEPRIGHELSAEIDSAASIDVVMAFVRRSGLLPLLERLRRHCQAGKPLRVLTTTYTNTTEGRALEELVDLGAEVRVSYETGMTRLHAKAWIFHRAPETTTAYLGSSNLTHSAQQTGLEWNVRLSAARNPDVIDKMIAVFDSYWENGDFVPYDADEFVRRTDTVRHQPFFFPPVGIELRPYQQALLDQLALARHQGHHRNLLVAATGTGKTVMAAMDYVRLRRDLASARLLFVAHREEILAQSRSTFAQAMRDPAFGELWVGGRHPSRFEHVFASIQSLAASGVADLEPDYFDVVVVDEFHHGEAPTYRQLLDHVRPVELLGLTATPERADGLDVLRRFGGRIAAELRLWDAISAGYLVPFAYYGIHDGTDLSSVPWRRGRGYDPGALTGVLTADHAWAHLVIGQVSQKVTDLTRMRALGFCVSVEHARFMAEQFRQHGIPAVAISGGTPADDRSAALADLSGGRVAAVFAVDLFNEGIDVPDVDTLLLLRPTESGTLFLQQLGRGLRRADGKALCTVLDFVGHHRKEFRYDHRFRALLGGATRRETEDQVARGFPFLPAGCSVDLDPIARETVLRSIRESLPSTWRARVAELRSLGDVSLAEFLRESGVDLEEIYTSGSPGRRSWTALRQAAGLPIAGSGPHDEVLLRAVGRLVHVDDPGRIDGYRRLLRSDRPPDIGQLDERERRLARMLLGSVSSLPLSASLADAAAQLWAHPRARAELLELLELLPERIRYVDQPLELGEEIPLRVHARYTRLEILAGLGAGDGLRPPAWQEGVRWLPRVPADVFAFTLDKTARTFSPTTRYRDYALSPELVHWESQSATSLASSTGQRYLHHAERGSHVLLFARLDTSSRAFWCLGPATYVRHQGDRPIAITWRLSHRLPADLFTAFAAAVA